MAFVHRLVRVLLLLSPIFLLFLVYNQLLSRHLLELQLEVRSKWGQLLLLDQESYVPLDRPFTEKELATLKALPPVKAGVVYMLIPTYHTNETPKAAAETIELKRSIQLLYENTVHHYPLLLWMENVVDPATANLWVNFLSQLHESGGRKRANTCEKAYSCRAINGTLDARTGMEYNAANPAPMPWDSPLCTPIELSPRQCLPFPLIFAALTFEFPPTMPKERVEMHNNPASPLEWPQSCEPGRIGYRHMCRVQTFAPFHPLVQGFDYYWRLDSDSELLSPLPYDPFAVLEYTKKSFGWVVNDREDPNCILNLQTAVNDYIGMLEKRGESAPGLRLPTDDTFIFYNNIEIGRFDFWRQKQVRDYFAYIDESEGTYRFRWGDAPIRTQALSIFMPKEDIIWLSQVHYRHEGITNYHEDSFERKTFRFLLDLPLPPKFAFYLLTSFFIPTAVVFIVLLAHYECPPEYIRYVWHHMKSLRSGRSIEHELTANPVDRTRGYDDPHPQSAQSTALLVESDGLPTLINGAHSASPRFHAPVRSNRRLLFLDVLKCSALIAGALWYSIPPLEGPNSENCFKVGVLDLLSFATPAFLFAIGFTYDKREQVAPAVLLKRFSMRLLPSYGIACVLTFAFAFIRGDAAAIPNNIVDAVVRIMTGDVLDIFYIVPVIYCLLVFGLLVRRLSIRMTLFLLLIFFVDLIRFYHDTPLLSDFWILRYPSIHIVPFLLGWISDMFYSRTAAIQAATSANINGDPRSFLDGLFRRPFMVAVTDYLHALFKLRSVTLVFALLAFLLIICGQIRDNINDWDCNKRRIFYIFFMIGAITTASSGWRSTDHDSPLKRTIRSLIVWASKSSLTLFLCHSMIVRWLEASMLSSPPELCESLRLAVVSSILSISIVRLAQSMIGSSSLLVLGSPPERSTANVRQ